MRAGRRQVQVRRELQVRHHHERGHCRVQGEDVPLGQLHLRDAVQVSEVLQLRRRQDGQDGEAVGRGFQISVGPLRRHQRLRMLVLCCLG